MECLRVGGVSYNSGIKLLFKTTDCRWAYNLDACNQSERGVIIIMGIAIIIIIIIFVVIIINVTIIIVI